MLAAGHQSGECVMILSANRVEWLYTQWGIMMAGGVATPGADFGSYKAHHYVRFAYTTSQSNIRLALERIAAFVAARNA